jgi:VanZ family protein
MRTELGTIPRCWLPVVALCVAIFVQSCFSSPDWGPSFHLKDKLLHLAVYGLMAGLFYRACGSTWSGRMPPAIILAASVLFASLYGASDEFHQSFVAARQADMGDWIADIVGGILGAGIAMVVHMRRRVGG